MVLNIEVDFDQELMDLSDTEMKYTYKHTYFIASSPKGFSGTINKITNYNTYYYLQYLTYLITNYNT